MNDTILNEGLNIESIFVFEILVYVGIITEHIHSNKHVYTFKSFIAILGFSFYHIFLIKVGIYF